MKSLLYIWACTLLVATSCSSSPSRVTTGKIIEVHTGDSVSIASKDKIYEARLAFIKAPHLTQPYGSISRQFLSSLVFLKDLQIISHGMNADDLVVELFDNEGRNINEIMAATGHSWADPEQPEDSYYRFLMKNARKSKSGLWNQPSPIPPWMWTRVLTDRGEH